MPHPLRAGRRRLMATAATMLAAIALCGCTPPAAPAGESPPSAGVVVAVVDGDTIDVDVDGQTVRVRLLGINAPEMGRDGAAPECYAEQARDELDALIYDQTVTLLADPTQDDADRYGRLLRYVYVGAADAGLALVQAGAAAEYTYDVAYDRQHDYREAEEAAQAADAGLWRPSCGF